MAFYSKAEAAYTWLNAIFMMFSFAAIALGFIFQLITYESMSYYILIGTIAVLAVLPYVIFNMVMWCADLDLKKTTARSYLAFDFVAILACVVMLYYFFNGLKFYWAEPTCEEYWRYIPITFTGTCWDLMKNDWAFSLIYACFFFYFLFY